ncbi:TetR/AcrR family transcriptional regulator [Vibrio sp.]|nr:TetR/AcrR family transcriptional regulator [Vibrio sp.]
MVQTTKRERTKQHILEKAWALFEQDGYDQTTTRAIARAANVSDGTVFSHFATKVDLLRAGMEKKIADIFESEVKRLECPTYEDLLRLCRAYYDYYFLYPELGRVLLNDALWQLDKFAHIQTQIQQIFSNPNANIAPQQADIIFDCYLMTLITHLSNPQSSAESAFSVLKNKLSYIINNES